MNVLNSKIFFLGLRLAGLLSLGFVIYAYFNPVASRFHFTDSDELLHVTGFLILSFLLAASFSNSSHFKLGLGLCLFGALSEIAQPLLTQRRELSLSDIGANWIGVILGICLWVLFAKILLRVKSFRL